MKENLNKLPEEIRDLLCLVGDIAEKNHTPAYLVGGFVRDLLLGVTNLDLDIVVEGDGIGFAGKLSRALKARLVSHGRFGTATVSPSGNLKIDVASARSEIYPHAGSLPVVSMGTLENDLARRDFTINAMAISLNRGNFAQIVDLFGGEKDLRNKKIRVLHKESFRDDPTRILRAVRFSSRYGFKIEAVTLDLLKEASAAGMLGEVNPQRLRDELVLILKEAEPLKEINSLKGLCGFDFISKGLKLKDETKALFTSVRRQISWFNKNFPLRRKLDKWLIYLFCLLEPLPDGEIKRFCAGFALRKGEEKRILSFKGIGHKFIAELNRGSLKPAKIFAMLEPLSYEVIIMLKAKYPKPNINRHIEDFFEIYNGMRLFVSGHDLHGFGLKPGPVYQQIFSRVLEAKLNGRLKTKQQELELIRRLVKKK